MRGPARPSVKRNLSSWTIKSIHKRKTTQKTGPLPLLLSLFLLFCGRFDDFFFLSFSFAPMAAPLSRSICSSSDSPIASPLLLLPFLCKPVVVCLLFLSLPLCSSVLANASDTMSHSHLICLLASVSQVKFTDL